jgi:hypothetical protein
MLLFISSRLKVPFDLILSYIFTFTFCFESRKSFFGPQVKIRLKKVSKVDSYHPLTHKSDISLIKKMLVGMITDKKANIDVLCFDKSSMVNKQQAIASSA